jgi:hypothetical protein
MQPLPRTRAAGCRLRHAARGQVAHTARNRFAIKGYRRIVLFCMRARLHDVAEAGSTTLPKPARDVPAA